MSWRLCLCLAVVATALPLALSSPTVTPNSKESQTDFRETSIDFSSKETNQVLQHDRNGYQSEEEGSLMRELSEDKILVDSKGIEDNEVDDDADHDAENAHFDSNNVKDETTPPSDYENALAAFPGLVSTLHDPDTYNWLMSYLPVKLPQLPKTFALKGEYKDLLYGCLKSANRAVVGNDHIRNAVGSANWLFGGYTSSPVYLYFKLALDAVQDYYENRDGAALRDRLDRVLHDFEDEEFERRLLERLEWWAPFVTVLWDPVARVSQQMGWLSAARLSSERATVRHNYKKWSDIVSEYMNECQAWTSRANTFIQSTGRLLLPNFNLATVSDQTSTKLLTCADCASFNVNLANIFFFLSALLGPLLLLALPIALAVWLAIVYGIKFKYIAHDHGGGGYGGGYGGEGGYGYSGEGGYDDDSYHRSDDTSFLGNLAQGIGNMMADSFINWGGVDSPGAGRKKKIRVVGSRSRYSDEYVAGGHKRRGESYGGRERHRPRTKYRRRSKPEPDTIYYDDYEDYYVGEHISS